RENRDIGGIAGAEIQRGLGAEAGRRLDLERLVLAVIAPQQAGPASAHRSAAGDGLSCGLPQLLRFGEAEIVIRGEIDACALAQTAEPAPLPQLTKVGLELIVSHRTAQNRQTFAWLDRR